MTVPVLGWFRDVGQYFRLIKNRSFSRVADYTTDEVANLVGEQRAKLQASRMTLKLVECVDETPTTKTLRFERSDGSMPHFRAGQYVNLFVEIDGVQTSRPFSISSAPGSQRLDLTVRRKPGGFVSEYLLDQPTIGTSFESTLPVGHFYYEPLIDGSDLVFLAGGSGITPMMSIIRDQQKAGWPVTIQLLFGCRTPDDVIFGDELAKRANETERFDFTRVISEPPEGFDGVTGFLDAQLISKQVSKVTEKTFFICGPTLMYRLCLAELTKLSVPPHRIRREAYGPPDNITEEDGWPADIPADATFRVDVEGAKTIEVVASEPLLNSLERNGLVVPAVCRSGGCSACRTKVLSGNVFMPASAAVREADLKHGYVHPCMCYPVEDLQIRLP